MEAIDAIMTRRSVRRFSKEPIDDATVQALLRAAMQACSAAIENLLLAAHALGLGAVWTGCYPLEDRVAGFVRHCELPEGVEPVGFIVLGHPAETPAPQDRYR